MELILATVNHQFSRAYFDVLWSEKDVHFIQNHRFIRAYCDEALIEEAYCDLVLLEEDVNFIPKQQGFLKKGSKFVMNLISIFYHPKTWGAT